MLASIERDTFTDDTKRLGGSVQRPHSGGSPLRPFAVVADEADFSAVLKGALQALVSNGHPEPGTGRYELTSAGRALCITGKRTLFHSSDIADLEARARYC